MLGRYLDHEYLQASLAERAAFERLLECADASLQEIFLEAQSAPDPDMEAVARKIRIGTSGRA